VVVLFEAVKVFGARSESAAMPMRAQTRQIRCAGFLSARRPRDVSHSGSRCSRSIRSRWWGRRAIPGIGGIAPPQAVSLVDVMHEW